MRRVRHRFGRDAFGDDPERYDAARPPYPQEIYDCLVASCGLRDGISIFEVGSGTGIATRVLLTYQPRRYLAIEPDARLAACLASQSGHGGERHDFTIAIKPFQNVSLERHAYDLGIAATSFHWVRQRTGLARVRSGLKPGGWWAMWWTNFGTATSDEFQIAIQPLFAQSLESTGFAARQRAAFDLDHAARRDQLARAGFARINVASWQQYHRFTTATLLDLYRGFSVIQALTATARERFFDGLADISERQFGGAPQRLFTTTLYTAQNPLTSG